MLSQYNTGLIVIDIQGKLAQIVENSAELMTQTARLIQGAQRLDLPIVWLEQNSEKLGPTAPQLAQLLHSSTFPINKMTFDATQEPTLVEQLRQAEISHWLVCGIEAHICVYQTVCGLLQLGYQVEVVVDAISARQMANKQLALNKMQQSGAKLTSVEMCLYEMVEDCRSPHFKTILSLIK
ncbi:isochorismatase family protein [Vibrio cincinnatiensis]|uniref:isochorismatase family protein n=1 Tax=Vibrio cincinnatiensis TaxID=675 RepID=UPI0012AC9FA0|nr:isochorismatase family protein [Vibrio cincinnatiensis]